MLVGNQKLPLKMLAGAKQLVQPLIFFLARRGVSSSSSFGDQLRCVPVPEDRYLEALEHLKQNFFKDEPITQAFKQHTGIVPSVEFERYCLNSLEQRMSCMFVDQIGKIAGTALNRIIKKSEREECERRLEELECEKKRRIFGLLFKLNERVDLFAKYGVDELFECSVLSVDAAFRGHGLGHLLIENSVETARNAGFKVIKADTTGFYSQKILLKHGFKVALEIPYTEAPEDLRPGPPHRAFQLLVKVLE